MAMEGVFPQAVVAHMIHWLDVFATEWHQDMPLKVHTSALDDSGSPQWHPEFARWLLRTETSEERQGQRNPDGRLRVTKAARSLREHSPRVYEVFYRIIVLGHTVESVSQWLNDRAIRGGHPERYRNGDTLAMLQAACHWIEQNY
jgi:hypothetical protein